MADEMAITVQIGGRPYRLFIKREEEEIIRKAAKSIEEQIQYYAGTYSYNDKQDLLAMAALHFAISAINTEQDSFFVKNTLSATLEQIDDVLTETLKD